MINRGLLSLTRLILAALLAFTIVPAVAAETAKPDFSGTYAPSNGKVGTTTILTGGFWRWSKTNAEITVRETVRGQATTNKFKLDGSEAPYTTAQGGKGTCTARFKGRTLLLDEQAKIPQGDGRPERQIRITEQWVLSQDSKTLRVEKFVNTKGFLGGASISVGWLKVPGHRR